MKFLHKSRSTRLAILAALALWNTACGDGAKDSPAVAADAAADSDTAADLAIGDAEDKDQTGSDAVPGSDAAADADVAADSDVASDVDTSGDSDTGTTCTGQTGCACTDNKGCESGLCGYAGDGKQVCLASCAKDNLCPSGFACLAIGEGKGCVEQKALNCLPCKDDASCGAKGACVSAGDGGSFCGATCSAAGDCGEGYDCVEASSTSGTKGKYCKIKDPAGCGCTPLATLAKASTTCKNGGCSGERSCGEKGLSLCSAASPTDESCDGKDNDCNGQTDDGGLCDDKNPCTSDVCGAALGCTNTTDDSLKCDDGNACTADACKAGTCGSAAITCDDGNPCTKDACDIASGCTATSDDSLPCSDNDACTADSCKAGNCASAKITCDDNNACTADACDPASGCTATADDSLKCSDNDACTSDLCAAGKCATEKVICDDKNPCTKDSCVALSGCATAVDDGASCSDGDPCTKDSCTSGACKSGDAKCDDANACTDDACDPGKGCVNKAQPANTCDDGDSCTKDSCDPKKGCVHSQVGGCLPTVLYTTDFACSKDLGWTFDAAGAGSTAAWAIDNTPAPAMPACSLNFNNGKDYACTPGATSADASWALSPEFDATAYKTSAVFTLHFTLGGGWINSNQTALVQASSDGKTWTSAVTLKTSAYNKPTETKVAIQGMGGKKFRVRFGFATGSCLSTAGTGPYIDDLEVLDSACKVDQECDDGDPCSQDSCDTASGACLYSPGTGLCDDDNACTTADACVDGVCKGKATSGTPCDDSNTCTGADSCVSGKCTGKALSKTCDDGSACTQNDACTSLGVCVGIANSCDDGNACTSDACDPATGKCSTLVLANGAFCSDGDACTSGDVCSAGACVSFSKCDDGNACTTDSCSSTGTCTNAAVAAGSACSDGDACTSGDKCAGTTCTGAAAGCKVLWQEAFLACEAKDWSLDLAEAATWSAWKVDGKPTPPGSFSPSCSLNFNNDVDFQCATGQKGVAGKAVSPVIDLTAAAQANLKYIAWFQTGSDTTLDQRTLEVSADGFKTVLFKTALSNSATMSSWQPGNLDLSAFVGKKIQVRFGFDSRNCTTNTGTGWFVDDLKVYVDGEKACSVGTDCDDKNACTTDNCTANKCSYVAKTSGTCDDGNPCTTSDACSAGLCKGSNTSCNDSNACTIDTCDPKSGCVYSIGPDGGSCGDSDSCTNGDACKSGKCAGPVAKCDDGNPCTKDTCSTSGVCSYAPVVNGDACSDGNPCTSGDSCQAGKCAGAVGACGLVGGDKFTCGTKGWVPSSPASADAPLWSVDGAPSPGFFSAACSLNFNGPKDNYACPAGATSVTGTATSSASFDLSGAKSAVIKVKSYGAVATASHTDLRYIEVSADDFATAPISYLVSNYSGTGSWQSVSVDLTPLAGKIVKVRFRFDSVNCDSNSGAGWFVDDLEVWADKGATCSADSGCDDKNPCTADTCVSGKCSYATTPVGACDDGNPCTEKEICSAGSCGSGIAVTCDDGNPCTTNSCAPASGCVFNPSADGGFCSDANGCTTKDMCMGGVCVGTATLLDGSSCSDGNSCSVGDACMAGKCVAKSGAADGTTCFDSSNPCVSGKLCQAGVCAGPSTCDDGNPCTLDLCEKVGLTGKACTYKAAVDGGLCDDGILCTVDDACSAGECKGKQSCTVASEMPADCKQGEWTFDAPIGQVAWAFDAAPNPPGYKSAPCSLNFNDGVDYAEASTKTFGSATSPAFTVPAGAMLNFQSYSDTETYSLADHKFIEVSSNGFQTVDLSWQVTQSAAQKVWIPHALPLASLAGKKVQYRFRFDSKDSIGNSTTGWFIDDIQVVVVPGSLPPQPVFCKSDFDCADDGNACTAQTCTLGKCSTAKLDGNLCDDGNGCTQASTCKAGACVGSDPLKDGDSCSDGTVCTVGDSCQAGKCVAKAAAVDGTSCSDGGSICETATVCAAGTCQKKSACDDGKACTLDSCTVVAGAKSCVSTPMSDGSPCDDGEVCTAGDACTAGSCKGTPACTSLPLVSDCNGTGWTLSAKVGSTGWAFDATPNPPGFTSAPCSLNFNNGLDFDEGEQVMGSATSPVINVGKAQFLSLMSYADTETYSFVDFKYIDVSTDGFKTATTVQVLPSSSDMKKWVPIKVDLSSFAGKDIQVRLRFDSDDDFSNTGAGWFIDDLALSVPPTATSACATDAQCSDGNPCTKDTCSQGKCSSAALDKALCDDDNLCTDSSACIGSKCTGSNAKACDDGDPCTTDSCDPAKGCVVTAVPGCGEVQIPYSQDFACGGQLTSWNFKNEAVGPTWKVDGLPNPPGFKSPECSLNFNDDVAYTCATGASKVQGTVISPTFDLSKLAPGTPVEVSFYINGDWESGIYDNLEVALLPMSGTATAVTTSYDDPGTAGWTLKTIDASKFSGAKFRISFHFNGDCSFNTTVGGFVDDLKVASLACAKDGDCSDGNSCTADTCVAGKCAFASLSTGTCDDGNACTSEDACSAGKCAGKLKTCDDTKDCTTDSCDSKTGACKFDAKAEGSFCSDGNSCTFADTCDKAGNCLAQVSADGITCSDGNACTTKDACQGGTCKSSTNAADGSFCSDDTPCTTGDACASGKCVGPTPACNDGNPCSVDECTKTGTSTFTCASKAGPDGVACDDGLTCTFDDLCTAGKCGGNDVCSYALDEKFDDCVIPVGWAADATNTNGVYWGTDNKPTPPGFYSGPCSLNFNNNVNYAGTGSTSKGGITTPELDLTNAKAPVLTFQSYGGMAESYDKRYIEVMQGTTVLQTVTMGYTGAPDLNKWAVTSVDLKTHIGKKVKIRFRFDADSSVNNGVGWFIDDLKLQLSPAPAIAVVKTSGFTFSPDVVTINAGDFVEFQMPQNQAVLQVDQASFDANDSTPLPGGFSVAFGKTKKVKFAAPGTYYYVSPSSIELGMKGKIIVK